MKHSEPTGSERILVVDDDPAIREVVVDLLSARGYACRIAEDAEAGLAAFAGGDFDLVVTDLKMPGHDGLWLIEQVLLERPDTAVVAISGFAETEMAIECLRRGAYDFVSKPFRAAELHSAVRRALQRRGHLLDDRRYRVGLEQEVALKTEQLQTALTDLHAAYQSTLEALAAALDARERDTGRHSQRVMRFTAAIAARMGIRGRLLMDIARGALLHDIGKIGVADRILLKPGRLDPDEWVEMRKHPEIGHAIVRDVPHLQAAAEIILTHQERYDGSGYPGGLAGCEIPLGARIFAVADAFDAIVSDRPYRRGRSYEAAAAELARCAGTQFDPSVVEVFLSMEPAVFEALREADGLVGYEIELARQEDARLDAQPGAPLERAAGD